MRGVGELGEIKQKKVYAVLLLLCMFLSPLLVHPSSAESFSWAGTWDFQYHQGGIEWYQMTLNQSGATVKGKTSNFFNSTIEGTVSGSTLEGVFKTDKTWADVDILFSLEMSSDGQSFNGNIWNPGTPEDTDEMNGSRVSGGGINLLIVPVNLQDQTISNSKTYYDQIAMKLVSYFKAVSYGQLSVNVEVYRDNTEWVTLPKTSANYKGDDNSFFEDGIEWIDDEVDFATYDFSDYLGKGTVAFISPTDIWGDGSFYYSKGNPTGLFETNDGHQIDAIYTYEGRFQNELQVVRGLAHEFAHALGKILVTTVNGVSKGGEWSLPDEYLMGNVEDHFSLMGTSTNKSLERVHLDSFTKEWLGWLTYNDAQMNKTYDVKRLDLMQFGDSALRYQIKAGNDASWYIFESRANSSVWDSDSSFTKDLEVYLLETKPNAHAHYSLNKIKGFQTLPDNLTDPAAGVLIKVVSFSEQGSTIRIENFTASNLVGAVASISGKVLAAVAAMVLPETGFSILPDVDLHAYDDNGNHVGMNYQTGVYENQINGAIASGDLTGGTEWIFVPSSVHVHFVTDSSDTAKFFQQYPKAASYSNGAETSTISMVYYSPNGSRYESQPAEQEIAPGSTIAQGYTLTENADGSYSVTTTATPTPTTSPTSTPYADFGITASAGPGGTISPEGTQFAYPGSGYTYTITPNVGYQILDVLVDGISQGNISTYTFTYIQRSHEISATFVQTQSPTSTLTIVIVVGIVVAVVVVIGVLFGVSRARKRSKPSFTQDSTSLIPPPPPP
jgi:hypothetical protein